METNFLIQQNVQNYHSMAGYIPTIPSDQYQFDFMSSSDLSSCTSNMTQPINPFEESFYTSLNLPFDPSMGTESISEGEVNPFEKSFDSYLKSPVSTTTTIKPSPRPAKAPRLSNRQAAARCRQRSRAKLESLSANLDKTLFDNCQLEQTIDSLRNDIVHIRMVLACHQCPSYNPNFSL